MGKHNKKVRREIDLENRTNTEDLSTLGSDDFSGDENGRNCFSKRPVVTWAIVAGAILAVAGIVWFVIRNSDVCSASKGKTVDKKAPEKKNVIVVLQKRLVSDWQQKLDQSNSDWQKKPEVSSAQKAFKDLSKKQVKEYVEAGVEVVNKLELKFSGKIQIESISIATPVRHYLKSHIFLFQLFPLQCIINMGDLKIFDLKYQY